MNVRLIVPNCNRNTSPLVAYGPELARIAGGFTATDGTGGWVNDAGQLIVEPVTVFDCWQDGTASYSSEHGIGAWRSLAARIARELKQDCVYLSFDGQVEFVRP